MKTILSNLLLLVLGAFIIVAFSKPQAGSVKGTVSPADAGAQAWAISKTDTSKSVISQGMFEVKNLRAGTYVLIIEAAAPYKNARREDVVVMDGQATDVGDIKLNK
jgi:hypothetical protein